MANYQDWGYKMNTAFKLPNTEKELNSILIPPSNYKSYLGYLWILCVGKRALFSVRVLQNNVE